MKMNSCLASPFGSARVYPFSAIVGQELMKLALLLNAIEPRTGGVLIRGEKGTEIDGGAGPGRNLAAEACGGWLFLLLRTPGIEVHPLRDCASRPDRTPSQRSGRYPAPQCL